MIKNKLYFNVTEPEKVPNILKVLEMNIQLGKSFVITLRSKEAITSNIISNKHITFFSTTLPSMSIGKNEKFKSLADLETIKFLFENSPKDLISLEVMEFDNTYEDIINVHLQNNHKSVAEFYTKFRKELEEIVIHSK